MDPKNLAKLKKSIQELGFHTAVIVRTLPDGALEILGGEHRTEVAIDLGLKTIPVVNVGTISDEKAKKIGLANNARYGTDDSIQLARLIEELGEDAHLTEFLPMQDEDLQVIMRAVDIDLDSLEVAPEDAKDDTDPTDGKVERPAKTHDILKFRVTVREAEAIRDLVERTIKKESLADAASDDLTTAGAALALMLLGTT